MLSTRNAPAWWCGFTFLMFKPANTCGRDSRDPLDGSRCYRVADGAPRRAAFSDEAPFGRLVPLTVPRGEPPHRRMVGRGIAIRLSETSEAESAMMWVLNVGVGVLIGVAVAAALLFVAFRQAGTT